MVAQNPAGPSAYGPLQANDGSLITSDEDGFPTLGATLTSTGGYAVNIVPGAASQNYIGFPVANSVLVELRVMNSLLALALGASAPDLDQMRADEAFNTNPTSGAQVL